MKKFFVFAPLFLLIYVTTFSQEIVPIDSVRLNDSNGVPLKTGQTVKVMGIVTSTNQFGNNGPGSIQDTTGGISVYGNSFVSKFSIGDSVILSGSISNYNGLTELNYVQGSIVNVVSSGKTVEPEVVTVAQIINQQWNGIEEYESKLIRINNVTFSQSGDFSGGTSGQNYDISDSTGNLPGGFRIDADVKSIIGTPIPTGKVDIVGILGQYKSSPPYNSGYQLMPRSISDIISDGSPLILHPVFAADIDTSSFTVYFNTARKGNSGVKFGRTPGLELDSVYIIDDTTIHKVKIKGLKPSTLYYYKAVSSNNFGISESDIQSVFTKSLTPSSGQINVYFNYPVDTTVAIQGNTAHGNTDFGSKLIERINNAVSSIDMAVYSFQDMPDVADALILAKQRGVLIRVVYDNRTIQNSMQMLINAGIKMSQRPPATQTFPGIMHNKFFIFDARDTVASNDWLWTGSWNITATELNWKNNVVEINDPAITKAYQTEFEEMWGSSTDIPDPSAAKFGNLKTDNTVHSFLINGKYVYLYFSPSDGTTNQIIKTINSADKDIFMAQFTITRNDIGSAIFSRYSAGATDIRGVVNNISDNGSEYSYLTGFADMHQNTGSTLHDKYGLVDASAPESDPAVITGSHNWTSAAETSNDENTLIIHDKLIANQYLQDFKKRYNEAGGTNSFAVPTATSSKSVMNFSFGLFQNYPNPFNPSTKIQYTVGKRAFVILKVYDILGREIATLVNEEKNAGNYNIEFNIQQSTINNQLPSGIYFYRLESGGLFETKKMLLLK